ncbi:hypothetical protein [Mesorhizobium sp. M7A.F.Ca.MR.362.00.0.0]|uniref:hypothetical protein n=1 Tax=Mesorhizobium sp. M7A.F.Ca.MR.362.00.0.0 TaxID=2496779 RepID=UPI0019D4C66D|nr:hypothetical protein [Mesorhizobium sp. M7A.F.Ca.MR.362.00.0.0]
MIAIAAMAIVSTPQAARRPGITATAAGPEVVEVGFGTAGGLIGHGGSGHARHRESGKKGVSQKSSHLKSPWLVSVHGCVSLAEAKWFTEMLKFVGGLLDFVRHGRSGSEADEQTRGSMPRTASVAAVQR